VRRARRIAERSQLGACLIEDRVGGLPVFRREFELVDAALDAVEHATVSVSPAAVPIRHRIRPDHRGRSKHHCNHCHSLLPGTPHVVPPLRLGSPS
jgi:hypothetical protein